MKEQWMKDMQDRFADFEQPAPEGLLDDIQREMEHRGLVPVNKASDTQRRLIPPWMRGAAAAAIVTVAIGTGTLLLMDNDDLPKPVAQEQTIETQTLPTYNKEPKNVIAEAKETTSPKPKQVTRERQSIEWLSAAPAAGKENLIAETVVDAETGNEQAHTEILPTIIEGDAQETKQELAQESDANDVAAPVIVKQSSLESKQPAIHAKRNKSGFKRWEVGASVAGMQGLGSPNSYRLDYANRLSVNNMYFYNSVVNSNIKPTTHPDHGNDHDINGSPDISIGGTGDSDKTPPANPGYDNPTTPVEDYNNGGIISGLSNYSSNYGRTRGLNNSNNIGDRVMINNQMYSMVADTHHRQPVKVGLSMRYHVNDSWSLQAGIDYSYHSSDLVLQVENYQEQSEQKLHFIGVPVALAYTLWNPGRFNIYLSAGGEIEKVVKGSRSTLSMASNMADREDRQDIEEKPWQLSIGGSAGVQFSITKLLSIYAEPGVAYYFDNKSSLPTIYQEKQFNFNINMGLRFNLGK